MNTIYVVLISFTLQFTSILNELLWCHVSSLGSGSWYHKGWQRKTSSRIFYPFQWLEQKVRLYTSSACLCFPLDRNLPRLRELGLVFWLNQLTLQQTAKYESRIYFKFTQTWQKLCSLKMVSRLYCALWRICRHFFVLLHGRQHKMQIFCNYLHELIKVLKHPSLWMQKWSKLCALFFVISAVKINEAVEREFKRSQRKVCSS